MNAVCVIIPLFWAFFWFSASLSQLQFAIPFLGAECSLSASWLGLLFLHLCSTVPTKAVLSRLMPVSHCPGNWGIILHPLMKPWHVLSPTLIMELRLWAYSCCQAQFHAWPNINYAWSNVLGFRCSPLICHSLFLPHLVRVTISVQLVGKHYTDNSRLSGIWRWQKYYNSLFPEFSLPYIFFSGKMHSDGITWIYKCK